MYPMELADSHTAPVVRIHWERLQFWKVTFFVESTFLSSKNKATAFCRQYYSSPRRNLLCYIFAITGRQENLGPSQLAHSNQHTPAQHRIIICGALFPFYPVLLHTSSASEELSFPLKNSALLYLLCFTCLLPSMCLQHWLQSGFPQCQDTQSLPMCWDSTLLFLWEQTFSSSEPLILGHHSMSALWFQSHWSFPSFFIYDNNEINYSHWWSIFYLELCYKLDSMKILFQTGYNSTPCTKYHFIEWFLYTIYLQGPS